MSTDLRAGRRRKRSPTAFCIWRKSDGEEIDIRIPEKRNEFISGKIKHCKKLTINSYHQDPWSVIDTLEIVNYPDLQELIIRYLDCRQFRFADLPLLARIEILYFGIKSISIIGFPNLKEIKMAWCQDVEQLDVQNYYNLEILNVGYTKIFQLDCSGLSELRKLDATDTYIDLLDMSGNGKLEKLNAGNTKISQLDV